jgi:RimJ/RimL family protein N-acetyltransferase
VISLKFKKEDISVNLADKNRESHRRGVWIAFNENLDYNIITTKPISYENHCKWWEKAFDKEYIYIVLFNEDVCGYIRLTKKGDGPKTVNEISIAIIRKLQNLGIGSYAYKLFEKKITKRSILKIVAKVLPNNLKAQRFFIKNGFKQIGKTDNQNESSQVDFFLFEKNF